MTHHRRQVAAETSIPVADIHGDAVSSISIDVESSPDFESPTQPTASAFSHCGLHPISCNQSSPMRSIHGLSNAEVLRLIRSHSKALMSSQVDHGIFC